jgi:hypothetical protein
MSDRLPITVRERVQRRLSALDMERSGRMSLWRAIDKVLMPLSGVFSAENAVPSSQVQQNADILDSAATYALGTLMAGMQSGMTSPARPWLKIETEDTDLMNVKAVSAWCDLVTQKMRTIFSRSNTYKSLHTLYGELGAFGNMVDVVLPDFRDVIRHYPLTTGEFSISADDRGEVNTLGRKYQMTVDQIVERFVYRGVRGGPADWSRVSQGVKNLWDRHDGDKWIPVQQLIQPRRERDIRKFDNRNMPFESIYIEAGTGSEDRVLSESGFKRFPALVTRWQTKGSDIYASAWPGIVALGDILQLQHEQLRKAQGIDYQTKPPLQVPISLKNQESDFLPGGTTYVDMVGSNNAVRTAFDVQLNMDHLLLDIQDVRQRINRAFFADLFLFLSNLEGKGDRTAREVVEIHEEKLLILGPVVENIENELLAPLVDITFDAMLEAGILPPPPPELEGMEVKPEFIGMLSQAQRSVAMGGVDRFVGAVASIAAAKQDPSVWDKVNTDRLIDKAAAYLGIDPELVNADDEVQAIRQQRAEAMVAQQRQEQAAQAAATAKDLAAATVTNDNALGQLVRGFAGVPQ